MSESSQSDGVQALAQSSEQEIKMRREMEDSDAGGRRSCVVFDVHRWEDMFLLAKD